MDKVQRFKNLREIAEKTQWRKDNVPVANKMSGKKRRAERDLLINLSFNALLLLPSTCTVLFQLKVISVFSQGGSNSQVVISSINTQYNTQFFNYKTSNLFQEEHFLKICRLLYHLFTYLFYPSGLNDVCKIPSQCANHK